MKNNPLLTSNFVIFTTRNYALANGQSLPAASRSLKRLAENKNITRVTKGIWANTMHPYFSPFGCVPLLLGSEQGYVSFLSALHRSGVLSQIPGTIQIATTGHARKLKTPIGTFEFLSLKPYMMNAGVQWSDSKTPYRIACAEKALLDTFYISTRKGRRYASLPEIDFKFDKVKLADLIKQQVKDLKIRQAIIKRLSTF